MSHVTKSVILDTNSSGSLGHARVFSCFLEEKLIGLTREIFLWLAILRKFRPISFDAPVLILKLLKITKKILRI
jgi:hypothetical protein